MEESTMEWLKLIATLLGGGAMGAIITTIVTNRRNRIQPIGKKVNVETMFAPSNLLKDHLTKITFSGSTEEYHFNNLYLVQIELSNVGNKDYSEFNFGLTLPNYAKVVNIKASGSDRHHVVTTKQNIYFSSPSSIVDLNLKPFNRKDSYQTTIYVTCEGNEPFPGIEFSSDMPVKFKEVETLTTVTLDLALAMLTPSIAKYTYEVYRRNKL